MTDHRCVENPRFLKMKSEFKPYDAEALKPKNGNTEEEELQNVQTCAVMIVDMGKWLAVSQLCVNTALVYMHRFYVENNHTRGFHKSIVSAAAIFLAGKTEEQPRKIDNIVRAAERMYGPTFLRTVEDRKRFVTDIMLYEEFILMSIGMDIRVTHPHPIIVKAANLIKAPRELAKTAYMMATKTLVFTRFCLSYPPEHVACACIHMACWRHGMQIPDSSEGKKWWQYVDPQITDKQIEDLCGEFIKCVRAAPGYLRNKFVEKGGIDIQLSPGGQMTKTPSSDRISEAKNSEYLTTPDAAAVPVKKAKKQEGTDETT